MNIVTFTLRELIRLILCSALSNREIARQLGISHTTVARYRKRLRKSKRQWEEFEKLDDDEILLLLQISKKQLVTKRQPDWEAIHNEMQYRGATLYVQFEEYSISDKESAYSYSHFVRCYRKYTKTHEVGMRQTHYAGECLYLDYAGMTVSYNEESGENKKAQIFVSTLGCSKYTFVFASESQKLEDWIAAINATLWFLGGVTLIVVCDNLKSAITSPGKNLVINRTFLEQGKHFGFVIVPTRVRKPKDKGIVENAVLQVERRILARLRKFQFFSVKEINDAIAPLLNEFNQRPFQQLPGNRLERFNEFDKPLLQPLPETEFEYAKWLGPHTVNKHYHVRVDEHFYSVPYSFVGKKVESRLTKNAVECFYKGKRISSHRRSFVPGGYSTKHSHQTKEHRSYSKLTPTAIIEWSKGIGISAQEFVKRNIVETKNMRTGMIACIKLQKLAVEYGDEKLEAACEYGLRIGSLSYTSIASILKNKRAERTEEHIPVQINLPLHHNVRGPQYFDNMEDNNA